MNFHKYNMTVFFVPSLHPLPFWSLSCISAALILLILVSSLGARSQSSQDIRDEMAVTLRGRVLDFKSGEPIAKALVSIRELKLEAVTDQNGNFALAKVPPGEIELYVSTVGYGLMRKKIQVQPREDMELEIQLGQESLKRSDEITVASAVFDPVETNVVSEQTLNNSELKNLAGVLIDDPLRAVQTLPGVSTGDDFNAQFAIRGTGFNTVGIYLDGVLMDSPFHTVRDINDGGSLTIFNGDLVDSVSLLSGGFPAKYGDRTSAVLNILTRQGSRERIFNRANLSATGFALTSEGPLGRSKNASWLISARKSYLDYLINRLTDDPSLALGFYDVQGKLAYNLAERHQFNLSAVHGNSGADRERRRERLGINSFLKAESGTDIFNLNWRWSPSGNTLLQSMIYFTQEKGLNRNRDQEVLYRLNSQQLGVRQDLTQQLTGRHRVETGYFLRQLEEDLHSRRFDFSLNRFQVTDQFQARTWQPGFYVQDTWAILENRLSLTVGGRFDRLNYSEENVWMPRASLSLSLSPQTKVTSAFGQYSQFPEFVQLFGEFGNRSLRSERSTHYILGVERILGERTRLRVEAYDLEEENGIFSPQMDFRLVNGQILSPLREVALRNTLRGYSRGVEFLLQRRSANKVSGWVSYSYGVARLRDDLNRLAFFSDFDQRHTLNVYGSYRMTKTLNLSSKYRYGSNFPIVGFYQSVGSDFFLSAQRNLVRIPAYSRLDVRANKALYFDRWKLTLYGEVINLLSRKNYRYTGLKGINFFSQQVFLERNSLFPFLPSAGISIEF